MAYSSRIITLSLALICAFGLFASNQTAVAADSSPSQISKQYASKVAQNCLGNWEAQNCLATVSESNKVMAALYAEKLEKYGKKSSVDSLVQHCAAATAATEGQYPAYAMKSAFTECANYMYDLSTQTGVTPDQSHYQIIVGAVLCLSKDRRCSAIETGLKVYK